MQESLTSEQIEVLNFYRTEVRYEFSMLSTRLNLFITCQSFLVVPFAILQNTANFKIVIIPTLLVILLGGYISWMIRRPLSITQNIIKEWMFKQRQLLSSVSDTHYKSSRDIAFHLGDDSIKDELHERSIAFSKKAPLVFLIFWICAFVWTLVRIVLSI